MKSLVFDSVTLQEVPVTIAGVSYVLRGATGAASCTYRNAMLAATKLNSEGKPTSLEGMADTEPLLVSLCLFDSNNVAVPLATILNWPNHILKDLYDAAKEISRLDEKKTEEELKKN